MHVNSYLFFAYAPYENQLYLMGLAFINIHLSKSELYGKLQEKLQGVIIPLALNIT